MSVSPRNKDVVLMIDALTFEALVARVFTLATKKASTLAHGEEFQVTLSPSDIPEGAHYGEIVDALEFRSVQHGLKANMASGWTYRFTKL